MCGGKWGKWGPVLFIVKGKVRPFLPLFFAPSYKKAFIHNNNNYYNNTLFWLFFLIVFLKVKKCWKALSHAHTLRINSERYLLHLLYTCFFFFWGGFTFCFWFVHLGFLIPGGRGSDFLSTDVKLANAIIYLFIYFYT